MFANAPGQKVTAYGQLIVPATSCHCHFLLTVTEPARSVSNYKMTLVVTDDRRKLRASAQAVPLASQGLRLQ